MNGPLKRLADSPVRDFQIVLRLQIEPELRRGAEVPRQPQGHLSRYGTSSADDFVNGRRRHAELLREPVSTQLQRLHEIVEQDIARMYGAKSSRHS